MGDSRQESANSSPGVILCNKTIKDRLISNARYAIYSGAPSFPMVASMRAGYRLLENGEAEQVKSNPPLSRPGEPR